MCVFNVCFFIFCCIFTSLTNTLKDIKNNNTPATPSQPLPITNHPQQSQQKKSPTSSQLQQSGSNPNKSHQSSSKSKNANKLPSWSQDQLQEAITSVITQRMRFTQASSRFNIPKAGHSFCAYIGILFWSGCYQWARYFPAFLHLSCLKLKAL